MAVAYVEAWRKNDPKLQANAIQIWSQPDILPFDCTIEDRIKQLAVVAYEDGELAGLSTLNLRDFPQLRQKFAFFRGYIRPAFRLKDVGRDMIFATYAMIEPWAKSHPEENIAGVMAIVQIPGVGENPRGKKIKMDLIGYTPDNEQVRMAWFEHFRVPPNMSPQPQRYI